MSLLHSCIVGHRELDTNIVTKLPAVRSDHDDGAGQDPRHSDIVSVIGFNIVVDLELSLHIRLTRAPGKLDAQTWHVVTHDGASDPPAYCLAHNLGLVLVDDGEGAEDTGLDGQVACVLVNNDVGALHPGPGPVHPLSRLSSGCVYFAF